MKMIRQFYTEGYHDRFIGPKHADRFSAKLLFSQNFLSNQNNILSSGTRTKAPNLISAPVQEMAVKLFTKGLR
jgi:hypothetical protein